MYLLSQSTSPAKLERLHELLGTVTESARSYGFFDEKIGEIRIAAEEAIVNIIKHAYAKAPGDVNVSCGIDESNRFFIEIVDQGIPFDPLSSSPSTPVGSVSSRSIGGLGIFFMMEMMDEVRYKRKEENNILTIYPV